MRKAAALLLVWTLVIHQVVAGGVSHGGVSRGGVSRGGVSRGLRRTPRMTPLWRILNSKPFGAYCQNNYECVTGVCRGGFCATMQRTSSVAD